jgi:hypothetical protein
MRIEVDTSIGGKKVAVSLSQIEAMRGLPDHILVTFMGGKPVTSCAALYGNARKTMQALMQSNILRNILKNKIFCNPSKNVI